MHYASLGISISKGVSFRQPIRRKVRRVSPASYFVLKRQDFNILGSSFRVGRRRCCLHPPCTSGAHPLLPISSLFFSVPFLSSPQLPREGETLIQFHLPLADKLSHPHRNFPLRRFFTASRRRTIYNRNPPSRASLALPALIRARETFCSHPARRNLYRL